MNKQTALFLQPFVTNENVYFLLFVLQKKKKRKQFPLFDMTFKPHIIHDIKKKVNIYKHIKYKNVLYTRNGK